MTTPAPGTYGGDIPRDDRVPARYLLTKGAKT